MSAPPPEATGQSVAAATDELKALGIGVIERHCSGRVWPAALTLLEHLTRDDRCLPPSARVLELGAGTGWMALNATKRRPDVRWCATETERENAAERLASNLALATAAARAEADDAHEPHTGYVAENPADVKEKDEPRKPLMKPLGGVAASALDWSRAARSPLLSEPWDVVVGSDLVYGEAGRRRRRRRRRGKAPTRRFSRRIRGGFEGCRRSSRSRLFPRADVRPLGWVRVRRRSVRKPASCGAPRYAGWGGDAPRRRRDAATRLRVFGGAGWRRGPRRRRVRGGGRGASPPASRAASARRRRGCRGGGHVRGRQSRRGGAARHGTAGGVSVTMESFGFSFRYFRYKVPISPVPSPDAIDHANRARFFGPGRE